MDNDFPARLKHLRSKMGLSQLQLSVASGISQKQISDYEVGRNKPRKSSLLKILSALDIDEDEFFNTKIIETVLSADEIDFPVLSDLSYMYNPALREGKKREKLSKTTLNYLGIDANDVIVTRCQGDSMSPTINSNDFIFIHLKENRINDGKIYIVEHGGIYRCKRLFNMAGGVRIVSDNKPEYPEERYGAEDIEDQSFHIVGRVFYRKGVL